MFGKKKDHDEPRPWHPAVRAVVDWGRAADGRP